MGAGVGKRAGAALFIRIGDYLHADRIGRLPFASRDAKAMCRLFAQPHLCGFPTERMALLTDKKARRDHIVGRLSKWLPERAQGAELAVIYFAGHGMVQKIGPKQEGFLLPYDADPDNVITRGVAMKDLAQWIDALDAGAVVVFLDCCHAGKVIFREGASLRSVSRDFGIGPNALQELAGRRRFLIASCDEGQKSIEVPDLGHGLFTYHLLQGIAGAGDSNGDGKVEVAELFNYVSEAVARDARDKYGREQKPWTHATWAERVYLSFPPGDPEGAPEVASIEQQWRTEGVAAAIGEIERRVAEAGDRFLIAVLRYLKRKGDPAGIPVIFRCLAHRSEPVRQSAQRALKAFPWEQAAAAVEELARRADEERMNHVLEGLAALEAHPNPVGLLDRLVVHLKGNLLNRAALLLERKVLGLELEKVVSVFREKNSPYQIQKVLGPGPFTAAYLARYEMTDLEFVVRVLRPEFAGQPLVRARFLELGRRSVPLVHQNLVATRKARAFHECNIYFVVRDYIDGPTLREALASGLRLEPLQVLKLLRQVLDGLTPLHQGGAAHGGIKPSNIFLAKGGRVAPGCGGGPDSGRGHRRHAQLHGPGAGRRHGAGDRPGNGRVRLGDDPLRAAHRPAAVPG